jgi:hypothetical protein
LRKESLLRCTIKKIIRKGYKDIKTVERKVHFDEIAANYPGAKSFKKYMRTLKNLGLVDDHGKSLKVVSLSNLGVLHAHNICNQLQPYS